MMKKCILSISSCPKLGEVVRDIIFLDSSIHNAVLRIVCTTTPTLEVHDPLLIPSTSLVSFLLHSCLTCILRPTCFFICQKLHISRLFDIVDIEGLELAISTGLDVLVSMISTFSKVCLLILM